MDNLVSWYTTTDGRLNRQPFWIGGLVLAVVQALLGLLVIPMLGIGSVDFAVLQSAISSGDMATVNTITAGAAQAGGWASLVLFLVFAYPIYALCVKRRHDRNSNGLDVVIYLALVVVLLLVQALGLGMSPTEVPGVGVLMMPTPLYSVLGAISGIFGLYLLVVMGFLKGTPGPNNYGPDPLGGN